ncbi:hemolysin family protein [Kineosporia succinea]|uniref:CBS domain containing-hemolysin-like protein n=2 Tax=Kineosporia succinea TaxID=84632 RepID=A0ABT9P0U3_9ACTN|nr:hemolysin family protein [Kineosporia succinea]MDP9825725.1 CBS domain containing-hemolysin-like protein [Kineosporia succinea]
MWILSLLLGVLVVLAITAVTGYFVAQEFAFMAVDRSALSARAAAGDTAAERALKVTRRTSFMLSGAQLGITVTGLLVGYVAEPLIGESLGEALGGVGIPTGVGVAIGTVLALLFSTLVQMIFGELFPKNLAIARPDQVSLWLATSTTGYLTVFGWLIQVFDKASNALLKVLGIEPAHDVEHSATARDLEHIVAESAESGDLPKELSLLLDRILDFPQQDVQHAMIPRTAVGVVHTDDPVTRVRELMSKGHSRYPVLGEDDAVLGVVHLQDVLRLDRDHEGTARDIMRPATLVPTTMPLTALLQLLVIRRAQMACVLDEWGGFAGLITAEDLAEELVGEITDEHDPALRPRAPQADDGTWVLSGSTPLDEAERAVDRELPRGDFETLAGLVIARHGSLPGVGTVVEVELPTDPALLAMDGEPPLFVMTAEVTRVERHVPAELRLSISEKTVEEVES